MGFEGRHEHVKCCLEGLEFQAMKLDSVSIVVDPLQEYVLSGFLVVTSNAQ